LQLRYSKRSIVQYIPSVACVLVEFYKTIISLSIVYIQERKIDPEKAFPWIYPGGLWNFVKLSVPSILYTLAANLVHYGMSKLHVPLFQVLYQFRIIATVCISVILFTDRKYSLVKWVSCFFLFVGIVIANLDPFFAGEGGTPANQIPTNTNTSASLTKSRENTDISVQYILAALSVLCAGISTAFAGVYSEKLLKETMSLMSPWTRNIQFGTLGVFYTFLFALKDTEEILEKGAFYGFELQVWALTINQAIGGLIVALVLVYLDSVTRSFAGSFSFILCTIFSVLFMGFKIHESFLIGSIIILTSTYVYSVQDGTPLCSRFRKNSLTKPV